MTDPKPSAFSAASGRPSRRQVATAAAWSAPAVVAAVAAPALAATVPQNRIVPLSYGEDIDGNDTLADSFRISATSPSLNTAVRLVNADNVPVGGTAVPITLSGHATFNDGSTNRTLTSRGDGVMILPLEVTASGRITITFLVAGTPQAVSFEVTLVEPA